MVGGGRAYVGDDGVEWSEIGSVNIPMAHTIHLGLAVTAHDNSTLSTGVFDGVIAGSVDP